CRAEVCGNGFIDDLYDSNGNFLRKEECDNGTNCNKYCKCYEDFITDPNDETSCILKTKITSGAIAGIVSASLFVFLVLVIIFGFLIYYGLRYKKVDIDIYKTQQPMYHFYITGSKRQLPGKISKYYIDPVELDYGNDNQATNIFETRFQRMEVKNASKNK
ncbi:protein kinase domain containing protein, partial [Entamoeba invadens IP1]